MPSGGGIARPGAAVMTGMYLQGAGIAAERNPIPLSIRYLTFSNRDDFSPALYANLCAFDVEDLGFHVRLQQWGRSGPDKTAQFSHVRLVYAFPDFGGPRKAIELDQDYAVNRPPNISPYELPYDGCQGKEICASISRCTPPAVETDRSSM